MKIIDAMEKKQYKAKVEIIREGEDGTQMFVLEKGTVTVTKVNLMKLTNFLKKIFFFLFY